MLFQHEFAYFRSFNLLLLIFSCSLFYKRIILMCKSLPVFLLLLCSYALHAQSLWTTTPENNIPAYGERRIKPQHYLTVKLNLDALTPVLSAAPERFSSNAAESNTYLSVPMPDGSTQNFRLLESPVMAPELQSRYPEIRCYTGYGVDNPAASLKCDLTPWGFHGMVMIPGQSPVFIDPYQQGNRDYYVVYYKKDYVAGKNDHFLPCETPDNGMVEIKEGFNAEAGDCKLRKYRLALACTGEYALFHGNTKLLVMGAMNTSMNRVNGVYEREITVTMQLVPKNDTLIFLNSSTDPYTNNNGSTMLGQNVTTCNNRIGSANYDIGHVFSTGGGGIAGLGVVCSSSKAQGVTGSDSPIGDPFDIDYVVHEMGHQFGAEHTQNNDCNRVPGSAVEPGSGSTIMGYAGICAPNVQLHSDDYFHALNLQQIGTFLLGAGNTCAVKINTGNNSPTVNGGADYVIPKSTTFALTATGSDPDGDALTYCWEQMDPEFATMPPVSTSTTGPLFRTFKGVASPTRYFPNLTDILNNANPTWEKLPSVARNMKFRVTVRDNKAGGGCTSEDNVVVTVAGTAGPFLVTAPNTAVTWYVGETKTITWSVNGTNAAPVNCANVRILLSTDGGLTFPTVLAASVPNNGTANITVPNQVSNTCRVKVESIGNIFFDISNQNFIILSSATPLFLLDVDPQLTEVCAGEDVTINLSLTSILGFSSPVNLSLTGGPAGAVVQFTPAQLTPTGTSTLHISGLTPAMAGNYTLNISGVGGSITRNATVGLTLLPGAPTGTAVAVAPTDGALAQPSTPTLSWSAVTYADTYLLEIATNPTFTAGSVVYSGTSAGTSQSVTLQGSTVYYWRVTPSNQCGSGVASAASSFQTGGNLCSQLFPATDVPKVISTTAAVTVTSKLTIPASSIINDADMTLKITHTYVGDLSAKITTPWGQTIQLFDQPGVPASTYGCGNPNVDLVFDDAAALDATALENTCSATGTALLGTFQSIDALAGVNGHNAQGDWVLSVSDNFAEDGGSLTAWSLNFCFPAALPVGSLNTSQTLVVPQGGSNTIGNGYLVLTTTGTAAQAVFTVLNLPQHGTIFLNGGALSVGATFTQADINAGLLTYTHNGDNSLADNFYFDAVDQNNNAWLHHEVFNISIVQNNLIATAVESASVLCPGNADAQITVTATGLNGQYQYSISNGVQQSSNVFSGLAAGSYTITVTGEFGFTTTSNAVVISDPTPVSVSASVNNADLSATAAGGSAPYTYSIDGMNFQGDNTFTGLSNGIYIVTAKDANGCTATAQGIVAVNTLIVTAEVTGNILCAGDNSGSISVSVGGGQAPILYSLDGVSYQDQNVFAGLSAGTYTILVKDNAGFDAATNSVTLTDPAVLSVTASSTLNVISAQAAGGTGAWEYSIDGTNFQTGDTFNNLPNGDYTVTAKDANGCTATTEVSVNVPALALTAGSTQPILCFGDQTGSIMALATGGIPPYEYRLNADPYQGSNIFTNLPAGDYAVSTKDAVGTEIVVNVSITSPALFTMDISLVDNSATLIFDGGTAPYTYTVNGIPEMPLTDLAPNVYTVIAADANGCTAAGGFEVLGNTIVASVTSTTGINCHGGSDGRAEICVNGGYPPITADQLTPVGGSIASISGSCDNNFEVSQLAAGSYQLVVTDNAGFTQTLAFTIDDVAELTATAAPHSDSIVVSANGGTAPYQYSLDGVTYQSDAVFEGLGPGVYGVRVLDANGCIVVIENVIILIGTVEPGAAWGLSVSPNPGPGQFLLTLNRAPNELQVQVLDAAGRLLHTVQYSPVGSNFSTSLDLEALPQGIYFLQITDGRQWGALRLSIVK
jgi:subtilisin-like proprotein convertase family protein